MLDIIGLFICILSCSLVLFLEIRATRKRHKDELCAMNVKMRQLWFEVHKILKKLEEEE